MQRLPPLFRWLAGAALAEWLIARTFTRSAIYMPKTPVVIAVYQSLSLVGQFALSLASLLALSALGWIAWREWRTHASPVLPVLIVGQIVFSLAFLLAAPVGWWALASQLLGIALLLSLAIRLWQSQVSIGVRAAGLVAALALLAGRLHRFAPALYTAMQWPGPSSISDVIFAMGELFVVAGAIALWCAYGRAASRGQWLLAALPAAGFVVLRVTNPAMTGILSIWSIGLTLFLPWPLYAVGLWLAGVAAISALRRDHPAGWAILLLAAGGYAPQLSTHAFLGLIALWLLSGQAESILSGSEAEARRRGNAAVTVSL